MTFVLITAKELEYAYNAVLVQREDCLAVMMNEKAKPPELRHDDQIQAYEKIAFDAALLAKKLKLLQRIAPLALPP